MTFGEKLQKLRAREGISQDALAELLNVSRQAVSKWERDETMPETEKIIRISDCFHVTTDYLLKDIPEEDRDIPHRREFGEWFRDRGWLLGWIPLLWGLWRMARMWTFAAYGDSLWMRLWMWLMCQPSVLEVIPITLNYRVIARRSRRREAVDAVLAGQIAVKCLRSVGGTTVRVNHGRKTAGIFLCLFEYFNGGFGCFGW